MTFNLFSELASKIYGAIAIAALLGVTVQTVRVANRDATIVRRDAKIVELRGLFHQANENHRQTKANYRGAQEAAAALERARLARVLGEQERITDEVRDDYRRRLADARAAAERLRRETAGAGDGARSEAGAERVPSAGDAAGGTAGAPAGPRLPAEQLQRDLIATEQAIQLDALITWVREQLGVDPNR